MSRVGNVCKQLKSSNPCATDILTALDSLFLPWLDPKGYISSNQIRSNSNSPLMDADTTLFLRDGRARDEDREENGSFDISEVGSLSGRSSPNNREVWARCGCQTYKSETADCCPCPSPRIRWPDSCADIGGGICLSSVLFSSEEHNRTIYLRLSILSSPLVCHSLVTLGLASVLARRGRTRQQY